MRKTLEELIERSFDIKTFFKLPSYEIHPYEDGGYSDFKVKQVVNLPTLLNLAGGLELFFFTKEDQLIVRLYERDPY